MRLRAITLTIVAIIVASLLAVVGKIYVDMHRLQNTRSAVGPGNFTCEMTGEFVILYKEKTLRSSGVINRGESIVLQQGEELYYVGGSSFWDRIRISMQNKRVVSKVDQ